jgi:hypothetical protein
MMAADLEKFARTGFYRGLGKLTSGYLQNDLTLLNELLGEANPDDGAAQSPERQLLWSRSHTDAY